MSISCCRSASRDLAGVDLALQLDGLALASSSCFCTPAVARPRLVDLVLEAVGLRLGLCQCGLSRGGPGIGAAHFFDGKTDGKKQADRQQSDGDARSRELQLGCGRSQGMVNRTHAVSDTFDGKRVPCVIGVNAG